MIRNMGTKSGLFTVRVFIFTVVVGLLLLNSQYAFADETDPTLDSSTPGDNSYAFTISGDIVLTFSEAVTVVDSGKITVYKKQGDTEVSADVTSAGSTVTINPDTDLTENTGYYVKILAAAIDDMNGNSYAGITAETGLNFSTLFAQSRFAEINKCASAPFKSCLASVDEPA